MDEIISAPMAAADSVVSATPAITLPWDTIALGSLYDPLQLASHRVAPASCAQGVAGDPVPYTLRSNDTVVALSLIAFACIAISLAYSRGFMLKRIRDFFREPRGRTTDNEEGGAEVRLTILNALIGIFLVSVVTNLIVCNYLGAEPCLMAIGLHFVAVLGYICLKWMVGSMVNLVFFGVEKNLQWIVAQLHLTAWYGLLLFPLIALKIYYDISVENVLIYLTTLLFLNKILTFYKSFKIFFQGNDLGLQTFLYFCALEIAPLLAFSSYAVATIGFIEINF